MLDPKASLKHLHGLNKTKYECVLSSYRAIKLELGKKRKCGEFINNVKIIQLTPK